MGHFNPFMSLFPPPPPQPPNQKAYFHINEVAHLGKHHAYVKHIYKKMSYARLRGSRWKTGQIWVDLPIRTKMLPRLSLAGLCRSYVAWVLIGNPLCIAPSHSCRKGPSSSIQSCLNRWLDFEASLQVNYSNKLHAVQARPWSLLCFGEKRCAGFLPRVWGGGVCLPEWVFPSLCPSVCDSMNV